MKRLIKILLGILISSALFAGAYFFIHFYGTGVDPMQMYENYKAYIIFLYLSIILIYICATIHSHITTAITVTLLLANFFILASFFTQGILGISPIEFYTLTILFLIALGITHIKYRIRYPLIIIIGIPFAIILLNHALPLYPNKPDFEGFYKTQTITINPQTTDDEQLLKKSETKITIKDNNAEQAVDILGTPAPLNLGTSGLQIFFSSKTGIQNTLAHITFPQGAIITMYPQSATQLSQEQSLPINLNIIQGKINVYIPIQRSGYLSITGDLTKITLDDTGDIQNLIDEFYTKENTYFINQIGGEIMLNPTIDTFIGGYINLANSTMKILQNLMSYSSYLSSSTFRSFDQNKLNYDEFHTLLNYNTRTTYTATDGSSQRIMRDTKKGRNSTNTKARRDIIKNTFNNLLGK